MTLGLTAARRKFPLSAKEIENLAHYDDEFRGLCDDLAAAEAALIAVESLDPALRAERLAECKGWIQSLSVEIENALDGAKVVPMPTRSGK
jgi:hypothetical protein